MGAYLKIGYSKIKDDYKSLYSELLSKKFGKVSDTDKKEDNELKVDTERIAAEAAAEAAQIVEQRAAERQQNDTFNIQIQNKKKEETEEIEADNKNAALDNETIALIQQYQELFGNNASVKSAEEIDLENLILDIQARSTDNKYNTFSSAEKAANAAILGNEIDDANKKAEESKKRQEAEEKNTEEKSIAEDANKDPKTNPFMDNQKNPFENIFDVTKELDKELEDAV